MAEDPNATRSGDPANPGGVSDPKDLPEGDPKEGDTVTYESYRRLLREKKKQQEENRLLREREAERDEADRAAKEQRLKDEGKWKEFAEEQKKRADEAHARLQTRDKEREDALKVHACLDVLDGSVSNDYLHLFDIDKIKKHPETGEFDPESVKATVEEFRQRHHRLIDKAGGSGNRDMLPNGAPRGGNSRLTVEEWNKLPLAEQKKRMSEVHAQVGGSS